MRAQKPAQPKPVVPHPPLDEFYVGEQQRRGFVDRVFDVTAQHYDWINSVMSFGSGLRYRRDALKRAGLRSSMTVLDVCTGTGLVARAALDVVGESGKVVGVDASMGMLAKARGSVPIDLIHGYVERLPICSGSFDFVTMGYALRHVADLRSAFIECSRVLKPGGTLLILELTRPRSRMLYVVTRFYLNHVVPMIARLGSRDARTLMRYFWSTVDNCVPPEAILESLGKAGLERPTRRIVLRLFSEYSAFKPA